MDLLHFYNMPKLETLTLSENPISEWNVTKFYNNTNLTKIVMKNTHEYVTLSMAMVLDFKEVTLPSKYFNIVQHFVKLIRLGYFPA
jgi:hypothetical protein